MLITFMSEWQATNQYNLSCSCWLQVFILSGLVTWSGITWRVLLKHGKENGTKNGIKRENMQDMWDLHDLLERNWMVNTYLFDGRLTTTPCSINHGNFRSVERGVTKTWNGNWNNMINIYICHICHNVKIKHLLLVVTKIRTVVAPRE